MPIVQTKEINHSNGDAYAFLECNSCGDRLYPNEGDAYPRYQAKMQFRQRHMSGGCRE